MPQEFDALAVGLLLTLPSLTDQVDARRDQEPDGLPLLDQREFLPSRLNILRPREIDDQRVSSGE